MVSVMLFILGSEECDLIDKHPAMHSDSLQPKMVSQNSMFSTLLLIETKELFRQCRNKS